MTRIRKFSPHVFPSTHWSLVSLLGHPDEEASRAALTELLSRYQRPLRTYLMTSRGFPAEDADDLLQGFLLSQVLEEELFAKANRERGRFRYFLLGALNHFVANALRHDRARRRSAPCGGSNSLCEQVVCPEPTPGAFFDAAWAREVIGIALERMRQQCLSEKREDLWGIFEGRTLSATIHGCEPIAYEKLAERHGMATVKEASNALVTAKRMFGRSLRAVVGEYERADGDIDCEIAELMKMLSA